MNTLLALFSGSWQLLAGIGVVIAAVVASWFGGKKIGKVQEKSRSDVDAARNEAARVSAVADKRDENIKEAKNVQAINHSLNDDDARNKLRGSSHHNEQ
ncbi:hypothetical protein AAH446_10885 [Erwinia sp. P6884]|uniref:hypothetical protein n=1 Tax=Erwiniaceae TaxID=1903409 RepID=UPI00318FF2DA